MTRLLSPLRVLLAAFVAFAGSLRADEASPEPAAPLTSIAAIRALSAEDAGKGRPVLVSGIVTRVTPYELFIQEGQDAIFVWQRRPHPSLQMGDYVELRGVTESGHLFPVVRESEFHVLDHRPLPTPRILRFAELASERGDAQWVEVTGVVRAVAAVTDAAMRLRVQYDGATLAVFVHGGLLHTYGPLLGARLRLRGVISGTKTPQRQLIEPVLWVSAQPGTLDVEAAGPADPFLAPLRPARQLLTAGDDGRFGSMVRVAGVVTCQAAPDLLFIRDGNDNLEIRLQQPQPTQPGDRIEAVGFADLGTAQAVLQNAVLRVTGREAAPVARRTSVARLLDFANEAALIEVEGYVREIFRRDGGATLLLGDGERAVDLEITDTAPDLTDRLPSVGSRIAVTAVGQIERLSAPNSYQVVEPAAVRLHLRSLADLRVLSEPPWWTKQRLLAAVAILLVVVLAALGWIWTLNRRVQAQTQIILGSVQKGAMLEERNRIAREFHDTLEQEIAGATILLDAIATVVTNQPDRAREGVDTARAMLRHSLDEAQQTVADLRNNDLFERDLRDLIEETVRERLRATDIALEIQEVGRCPELGPVVKKHLLRIVQECVNNAVKHAAPRRVIIALLATAQRLELQVSDDGCGFDLERRGAARPGEFGLVGLQERAEKIGATLTIQSAPARGTTVALTLPLAASVTTPS